MHVRDRLLELSRRARRGDDVALTDASAALGEEEAEMRERHPVPTDRRDGDRQPMRRDRPGERDVARDRRAHRAAIDTNVDPTVLAGCVGVVGDRELAQNRTVCGPAPGARSRREHEASDRDDRADEASRCPRREHPLTVARTLVRRNRVD